MFSDVTFVLQSTSIHRASSVSFADIVNMCTAQFKIDTIPLHLLSEFEPRVLAAESADDSLTPKTTNPAIEQIPAKRSMDVRLVPRQF